MSTERKPVDYKKRYDNLKKKYDNLHCTFEEQKEANRYLRSEVELQKERADGWRARCEVAEKERDALLVKNHEFALRRKKIVPARA